jgi:hypothetical protein
MATRRSTTVSARTMNRHHMWRMVKILRVQVYALTSTQIAGETLDLFLTREAAETELREILEDEPDWNDMLRVVPIERWSPPPFPYDV